MPECCKNTCACDCVISPNSVTGSNGHIARLGATSYESNGFGTTLTLSDADEHTETGTTMCKNMMSMCHG